MKSWVLDRKLGGLQSKMKEEPHERAAVFDFERTFTEGEKALICKMAEVSEKFAVTGSLDFIDANIDVVLKFDQVMLNYAMFTLREILLCQFGKPESEIDQWFFNVHFYNFFMDLTECLQRVRRWPSVEREAFLRELNENGLKDKVYRLPRDSDADLGEHADSNSNSALSFGSSSCRSEDLKREGGEER